MTQTSRQVILQRLISSGHQISPDALEYLTSMDNPDEVLSRILDATTTSSFPAVISRKFLELFLSGGYTLDEEPATPLQESVVSEPTPSAPPEPSKGTPSERIAIIKNPVFDAVGSAGTIEDFHALFRDRFERIRRIYMSRIDTQSAISPRAAKALRHEALRAKMAAYDGGRYQKMPTRTVYGIVSSKSVSRSRNIIIELEDEEDSITCIIPMGRKGPEGAQLLEKGNTLLLDEPICISGHIDQDGRLIAHDIIYPDIPFIREIGRAKREVYAAFISDIHCGSEEFLEDEFDSFIDWLNGKDVDSADKNLVRKIEYLFIAGDLVDGIGVYPEQEKNLRIPDIVDQYDMIAKKLRRLNKRVTILSIPGNHDASRQAIPKPPVPRAFAEPLYKLGDRMILLGDPSFVKVEGVGILLTHGDSMDDLVVNIPGASYVKPEIGMTELLKKRHLSPLYGGKTELAPLHRDWLVIDSVPDIVHFGHSHHNAVDTYRRVQIINSGTFQGQTDFMRKQGIVPTPGIVTLFNLMTGIPEVRMFYDFSSLHEGANA